MVTECKSCSGQRPAECFPHQAGFKKWMALTIHSELFILINVLFRDVFGNDLVRHVARTATEVSSCPQVPSQKLLLQMRIFGQQMVRRLAFQLSPDQAGVVTFTSFANVTQHLTTNAPQAESAVNQTAGSAAGESYIGSGTRRINRAPPRLERHSNHDRTFRWSGSSYSKLGCNPLRRRLQPMPPEFRSLACLLLPSESVTSYRRREKQRVLCEGRISPVVRIF